MMAAAPHEEIALKIEMHRKHGFAEWLDQPLLKAMVSMIPPGPDQDHVRLVLQAAYDAGFQAGGCSVMLRMVETVLTRRPQAYS
jgi:hypothetical protein